MLFSLKFTAQLFGSPPPQQSNPPVLQQQTSLTRTPSNTPTPTPPPQILSPPVIPVTAARKTTSLQESGTVHHLAQTPHHANVATYMQGQGQGMCNYIMNHTMCLEQFTTWHRLHIMLMWRHICRDRAKVGVTTL